MGGSAKKGPARGFKSSTTTGSACPETPAAPPPDQITPALPQRVSLYPPCTIPGGKARGPNLPKSFPAQGLRHSRLNRSQRAKFWSLSPVCVCRSAKSLRRSPRERLRTNLSPQFSSLLPHGHSYHPYDTPIPWSFAWLLGKRPLATPLVLNLHSCCPSITIILYSSRCLDRKYRNNRNHRSFFNRVNWIAAIHN